MLPKQNEIVVCQITASYDAEVFNYLFHLLNEDERLYLMRYKKFVDRYNSLLALSLVKKLSQDGRRGASLSLLHTELGQPYFSGSNTFISIAHCEETIVVAMSSHKVGIDVEVKLSSLDYRLFLADAEYHLFYDSKDKVDLLTTIWTLKEAYVKFKGTGFFIDPKGICFNKINDRWVINDNTCTLYSETLPNGLKLSIASEEEKNITFNKMTESKLMEWFYST